MSRWPGPAVFFAACALGCATLEESGSGSDLASYVASEFQSDGPGGVVLIARGGTVLLRAAYGTADLESGEPMRVDHRLPIGSLTKSFTAAAILLLAQEGALDLEDDATLHYPNAPTGGQPATLDQLLAHTSGIANLVDTAGFMEWAAEPRTLEELLDRTRGVPRHNPPGAGFAYSDSGYILLGAIIERVSGLSYEDFIERSVAAPLGMFDTGSALRPTVRDARGYSAGDEGWVAPDPLHMSVPHASGALASTVDDLWLWIRAWSRGDIFDDEELQRRAWSGRALPDGTFSGYGYGWKRCELAGRSSVFHGGWVPGFEASVTYVPDEDLVAIVLCNTDSGEPTPSYVGRRALRLLLTGDPQIESSPLDERQRARFVGRYRTERGTELHFVEVGEELFLRWGSDAPEALAALSPTRLAAARSDGTFCFDFEFDEGGKAVAVRSSLSCEPGVFAQRVP